MNISNKFSDEKVNTGRQVELDIAKALAIIFMIFLHTGFVVSGYNANLSPTYSFLIMNVLGRPYAAVIFMFCMGVGVVYSRHSQWDVMIKRGVKLFLLGILVNLFEFFIPYFTARALSVNPAPFDIVGGLMLFCVDILAFAGLAFILMGILKKFEVSNKKLIIIAIVMSILGTLLKDVDFANTLVNLFFANFIGCKGGFTAFPLFNWFIFPISGYVWGQYFIRAKDKSEFFKFWPILLIVALLYFFVSSKLWGGVFSADVHFYYFMNTLDVLFCIINAHAVIGLCYWMAKFLPDAIIRIFSILSSNINTIYIAQWFFIPLTVIFIVYFDKGVVFGDLSNTVISIAMLIISTLVALAYKKVRTSKS
ncbi:heparan-alpha-glucosaminide N-acetyltransferase domain-containing protein [Methanobrevibacter sp.]|uniref:heparan-alpha-glucosaminide N-acetyltransferase domain-containing protein n=1 Tax=Methanobrevibacter sp. TaxID=66852 RepID=UPI00386388BC